MSDDMNERDYERMLDTFRTASEWHSGQWSALYSYSSTGEIHGEDHKADLLDEIERCEVSLRAQSVAYDYSPEFVAQGEAELAHLQYVVECWPNEAI